MIDQVKSFVESLKNNPRVLSYDEAATKQAIILNLLHLLGWNTYNIDECTPEFSVENRKVDYSLRVSNTNEVFIEVKKTGVDLEKHQEQLLDYSFRQGVELAILTNGTTWWFYLPTKKGDWKTRKFYTIDIIQQESYDIAQKFIDLLSKTNVQTGKTLKNAEEIYKGRLKKKVIEETLPEAWNKLMSEPDSLLLDLLAETTEKLSGFKPDINEATRFLKHYESHFLLLPEEDISTPEPPRPPRVAPAPIDESKKLSQDDLIPIIVKVLQKHGGRIRKDQVEEEIYKMFRDLFQEPWYKETVSNGVPRWQHNIAWAKERAKRKGLIKRPDDSGRGYWELTATGMKAN